jgi:hypothetical protein
MSSRYHTGLPPSLQKWWKVLESSREDGVSSGPERASILKGDRVNVWTVAPAVRGKRAGLRE